MLKFVWIIWEALKKCYAGLYCQRFLAWWGGPADWNFLFVCFLLTLQIVMCWVGNHLFIRRQNYKLALEFFHSFLKLFFFPAFWKDVTLWELTVTLEPLVLCPSIHGSKKPRQCLLELSIWRKRDWEIVGLLSYLWSSPVTWRARSWNCVWGLGVKVCAWFLEWISPASPGRIQGRVHSHSWVILPDSSERSGNPLVFQTLLLGYI